MLSRIATGVTTVTFTPAEVLVAPRLSVAEAVKLYTPAARLLTVKLYGMLVTEPREVEFLRNSTLLTDPSLSEAVACRTPVHGAEKVPPLGGLVMLTLGG